MLPGLRTARSSHGCADERLLRLDGEERRKEYRRQEFISLDKIPTWREDNQVDDKEEEKELMGGGGLSDKVSLYKGDITVLEVDAIVNAANSSLLGGGGVDGCIHKAAGSCLYDECHSLNGCDTGKAKITCGYDLPAKYVIHTVGPVARGHVGPTETNDLTSCYQNSLRLMKEHGLSTVAFPCISTGIYGFPNEPAADIALNTVKSWIEENSDKMLSTMKKKCYHQQQMLQYFLCLSKSFDGTLQIGTPLNEWGLSMSSPYLVQQPRCCFTYGDRQHLLERIVKCKRKAVEIATVEADELRDDMFTFLQFKDTCQTQAEVFAAVPSCRLCVLVISRVIFCVFLETDFTIYKKQMSVIFQDNDMEVTEEQLKGDNTPPSTKSTTKEEREDINR
ncbi:hypothetical protein F2P81_020060, partial [Scophthalmus maximus]